MSVTTVGIRRTTTVGGEIRRTPPVTVTTATRFVNCSACGQKRIGREACGASPIDKVRRTISKGSNLQPLRTKADDLLGGLPALPDSTAIGTGGASSGGQVARYSTSAAPGAVIESTSKPCPQRDGPLRVEATEAAAFRPRAARSIFRSTRADRRARRT